MSPQLQTILDSIQNTTDLSESEKESLIRKVKEADKAQSLSQFKLDRLEKDRNTLTIMLQESIEDLQKKSRAIEAQNRELEIESSLEKVRTVAMGMRKRDDMLDICRIISGQLELLGIKEIRNVQTAIFYKDKGTYINYEYYRLHDKALVTEVDYTNDEMSIEFAARMIKGADEVFVRGLEGQQVKDWLNVQKTTNVFIDTSLENARSLTYYWFSLGPVAIGMSTYDPLHEEEITLFKRFRNVFDLAYRRYLDIEKAEAQAREAQIEAALEKVRSHSLAMHKSDELESVVTIVFEKLHELGVVFDGGVGIYIFSEGSKNSIIWVASPDHFSSASCLNLPYQEDNFVNNHILLDVWTAREKGIDFYIQGYSFEEKNIYFKYLFEHNDYDHLPAHVRTWLLATESYTHSVALVKNSAIVVSSWTGQLLSENDNEVLKRFSKVFEQAYIRFLDLQTAEAQARESQIQLALERVRARTMAMQKSDELTDVAELLFKQVNNLGIKTWTTGFNVWSDDNNFYTDYVTNPQGGFMSPYTIDAAKLPGANKASDAKKRGDEFLVNYEEGEALAEAYRQLTKFGEKQFKSILESGFEFPSHQYEHFVFGSKVSLMFITYEAVPEAHDIFKRFGKVFEQTYTRFLDLQKAEAQAREAQIEAALERVRSRTMAMQKSDEMTDVAGLLFEQVSALGIKTWTAGFNVWSEDNNSYVDYIRSPQGGFIEPYTLYTETAEALTDISNARKSGVEFDVLYVEGEKIKQLYRALSKLGPEQFEIMLRDGGSFPSHQYEHFVFGSKVSLMFITYELVPEAHDIFKRLGKVFEQTYTRFLDLQKAEAQVREAQIEAVLEKIRSQSLAMHHSDELKDVIIVMFKKLSELKVLHGTVGIQLFDYQTKDSIFWAGNNFQSEAQKVSLPYDEKIMTEDTCYRDLWDAMTKKEVIFNKVYSKEQKDKWFEYVFAKNDLSRINSDTRETILRAEIHTVCFIPEKHSALFADSWDGSVYTEDDLNVLKRAAKVFEQAYVRFLDLQKAEAQAKEAQIEAALERVRSRTMAMQKSAELRDAAALLFNQIQTLGATSFACGFGIWGENRKTSTLWMSQENLIQPPYAAKSDEDVFLNFYEAAQRGESLFVKTQEGEELKEHYKYMATIPVFKNVMEKMAEAGLFVPTFQILHSAFFAQGYLLFITYEPVPELWDVFKRFAKVFEQTYTRFLDLQKAEAQAREAQIEAALERVRARAMAMHRSEELNEVANEMRKQLGLLGQNELETCAIHLYDESPDYFQSWAALLSPNVQGEVIQTQSQFPKRGVKIIEEMLECYAQHKQDYVLINEGAKAQQFLEMIKQKAPEVFEVVEKSMKEQTPEDKRAYWSVADFAGGSLVMTTMIEPGENSRALLRRFANVFGLAYRRFTDLKKAEAQAREAQIETALERVRSRTLAMQKSDELAEAAAVLFKQLILLGINPNRLYINIIKDETAAAEFWITDEDGSKISMEYEANMNVNASMKKMYEGWRKQNKSMVIDMHGEELEEYFKHLSSLKVPFRGGLSQKRRLQYIAYFSKGFIGMASPDEQPAETMQLLERFAAVFNLTFTRFNDLKIAEAHALQAEQDLIEIKGARKKAEDALTELQATQKQLVQSEKMASLGELTAGIAHEIQNPLNFVNNFSDVSNELLEEMKAELEKGNTKDVIAIVDDVKQNLEKILHHGKRADAIVKGMLQHSRTSSSQKELTDINALADEYLRLAYHGLRAKDKSFNAKFETDFDNSVGKINIIPQEIGRVILNLINNAFYAVSEKQKAPQSALGGGVMYEPTVSVSTKQMVDKVLIVVADNGGGIPQKNLEKIFQPFFTTKPTGQGTGLGLSLAYDIVTKGHNGEMKVETQEGEGSKFIVQLPIVRITD